VTRSGSSSPVVRLMTAFPDMAASHSRCLPYRGSLGGATAGSIRDPTGFPVVADYDQPGLRTVAGPVWAAGLVSSDTP
jgi:hypothetical protein